MAGYGSSGSHPFPDIRRKKTCVLDATVKRRATVACFIRDGATLVQNAADVVEAIRPFGSIARVASPVTPFELPAIDAGSDERGLVEQLLGPSPVPVDEIVRLSQLPNGIVQLVLLELDLAGRLDRHAGGKVSMA